MALMRRSGVAVAAAVGAGAVIASLPTLLAQLALVMGAWGTAVALGIARAGRVLDPAWIIVTEIYLIGPVGFFLLQANLGAPVIILMGLALAPFVIAPVVVGRASVAPLKMLWPVFGLAVLSITSLAWSPEVAIGAERLQIWLITGVIPSAYIVILGVAKGGVSWRVIAATAFVASAGLLLFGTDSPEYPGRETLFGANPIWAARAAYIGATIVLLSPVRWVFKLVGIPIMVVAGLYTDSLGPTLAMGLGVFTGMAAGLTRPSVGPRGRALGWLLLAGAVVLVVSALLSGSLDGFLKPVGDDPNVTGRANYLEASIPLFLESPIFGHGIGGFAATGLDTYPHNLVAELATETGLLGLTLFVVWLATAVKRAFHSPLMLALVVQTFVYTLFSGSVASNVEFWLFTALAVALAGRRQPTPGIGR